MQTPCLQRARSARPRGTPVRDLTDLRFVYAYAARARAAVTWMRGYTLAVSDEADNSIQYMDVTPGPRARASEPRAPLVRVHHTGLTSAQKARHDARLHRRAQSAEQSAGAECTKVPETAPTRANYHAAQQTHSAGSPCRASPPGRVACRLAWGARCLLYRLKSIRAWRA